MDVTDEEAPTTPDTTTLLPDSRSAADPSLQVQPPSSMLLMDPAIKRNKLSDVLFLLWSVGNGAVAFPQFHIYNNCSQCLYLAAVPKQLELNRMEKYPPAASP